MVALIHRLLPWGSLVVGIFGALLMDRGPARGVLVAVAGVASWIGLLLAIWIGHVREAHAKVGRRRSMVVGAHFSTLWLTQSSIHLQLYFALPFYFKAFAGTLGHGLFLLVLSIAAAVSLWDPLTEHLLTKTRYGAVLVAFANFVAFNAVLPGLGLSHGHSLWVAAAASAIAVPAVRTADQWVGPPIPPSLPTPEHGQLSRSRSLAGLAQELWRRRVWLAALLMPAALALGAARWIPAAPLHLVSADIGTRLVGREVVEPLDALDKPPAQLVCGTAIFAPQGLHDRLYHVWRHDGAVVDRIALVIRGGREAGFRTWSIKRNFGSAPMGVWECAVETEFGQFLGARQIRIGAAQ